MLNKKKLLCGIKMVGFFFKLYADESLKSTKIVINSVKV